VLCFLAGFCVLFPIVLVVSVVQIHDKKGKRTRTSVGFGRTLGAIDEIVARPSMRHTVEAQDKDRLLNEDHGGE
jgi:hypothetical protein